MSIHASALFLLATVPCSLSAQVPAHPWNYGDPDPCLPFEPDNSIEWPSSTIGDPADYRRLVMAELDGDQAPEGVAIEDGEAVVFWNLAVYDAPQLVTFPTKVPPTAVRDIAALPGGGTNGTDAVLMTDARGLFRVTWKDTVSTGFPDPEILADGDWVNAAPIHVDDLDLDGDLDVLGVSADGRKILTRLAVGAAFVPGVTVSETVAVREAVAVDWNRDGTRELAALSEPGLLVHDGTTGAVVQIVRHTSASGCLARFRGSDVPGDELLAWTRGTSSGVSQLAVFGGGILRETSMLTIDICDTLTNVHPTAVLAGDYDENGTDELLLVHQAQHAIVLANQGSSASRYFLPWSDFAYDVIPLSLDPLAVGPVGIPAFAQLDGMDPDGTGPETAGPLDLAFPVSATAKTEVFLNPGYYRALPLQQGSGNNSAEIVSDRTEFGYQPGQTTLAELRFAFAVPSRYDDYPYLDLILWEELAPVQSNTVSTNGLAHRRHALFDTNPSPTVHDNAPHQWVPVDHDFLSDRSLELCWDDPKPCYYTEYRFVKVMTDGSEVKSPIFTGGFTLQPCDPIDADDDDFDYLITHGIPGTSFFLHEDSGLPGFAARDYVGLYVPMSSQPPFADGAHPSPGTRTPGACAVAFE